jgi:glycosyltransferase involved in cell wall biosynthesis
VRDTDAWKPGSGSPEEARRRLGIADERVVMFLGTPRGYKGLDDLGAAVTGLGRKDVRLAVVGTLPESVLGRDLARRFPSICLAPPIAFEEIPSFLSAADVVVVPQRDTPDTRGQVPAKLFDAMALGRPIVSTRVSMIPEILEGCGLLVEAGDVSALGAAIARLLDDPGEAAALARRARERCVDRYSFSAARRDLFPLIEQVTAGARARR